MALDILREVANKKTAHDRTNTVELGGNMKTIKISIIGFGAVGQGVARSLLSKQEYLKKQGYDIRVLAISDSKAVK